MSSRVVGIDIGSVSVRAIELKNADKPNPVIVRFHEVPLPDGSVRRGEVLEVSTVATALKSLWSTGGFKSRDIILGMGGPGVLARDLAMPRAPLAQIKEALPFRVQDLLPVPVADAILDFYPINEDAGENGPVVNGLLIAVIKEAVVANIAAVSQAGLRTVQVDLTPFALARALAPRHSSTGLVAIVSIGANSTNVIVVRDGVPQFVRIVTAGGDDITSALASQLQVSRETAEELKREVGLGVAGMPPEKHPAVRIAQEVTSQLLISLRDTLSYYVHSRPQSEFDHIILSGGGSHLIGLASALGQITALAVVQAPTLSGAHLSAGLKARSTPEQREALTTAFGLASGTTT